MLTTTTNVHFDQPVTMEADPLTDSTLTIKISEKGVCLAPICLFIERQHVGAFLDVLDHLRTQIDNLPVNEPWLPANTSLTPLIETANELAASDDEIPF